MPTVTTLLTGHLLTSNQGNPAFCSVLLVEDGNQRVLFDFGHVGRRRHLLEALANRGLAPGDLDQVVLSHAHWDHAQNVDLFAGAQVFVHPAELNHLPDAPIVPRWTKAMFDGLELREAVEGHQVMPGVEIVELPGHTPGSIGLSVSTAEGTAVLAADAVPTLAVLRACRASGRPYDQERADASVERVAALADIVYPGHDQAIRVDESGEFSYAEEPMPLEFRVP
ncbi:MBL fold metallo-hydrolase [Kribbella pittospori]|uniref:MBL fold metallo-hydrolase n=1 Tax=Kribbella pittospori TaxID=722689 RepID=A0A4R0KDC3_9ACTN|nr:MBL fold metallo-hydrolase [Kribbella pittospori]TCC56366.1 MBL fold metallo-hydrolase [Kribbella pittospori]